MADGCKYKHRVDLAPTKELLKKVRDKSNPMSRDYKLFEVAYRKQLETQSNISNFVDEFGKYENVVLLCSEPTNENVIGECSAKFFLRNMETTLNLEETYNEKRVFLLAVSCKNGGLCPGGIDLDNPKEWIRIVRDDGQAGAVQGYEIDFAKPLDVIEFDGRPLPQGKQKKLGN